MFYEDNKIAFDADELVAVTYPESDWLLLIFSNGESVYVQYSGKGACSEAYEKIKSILKKSIDESRK